jgi:predicted ester cyclase
VIARNVQLVDELFDPATQLEQGSLDALRAQMEAQAAAFDGRLEYVNEFVDGEWVVHRMDITMTMSGPFMGQEPTGKTACFHEVEAARVREGRIVEMWSSVDRSDVFRQLGLPRER